VAVSPAEFARIVFVLLDRGDGTAFIHDSDLADMHPGDEVQITREQRTNGFHLRIRRANEPVDMGEARVVETLQLPGPGA
jgi:hypothetical protein